MFFVLNRILLLIFSTLVVYTNSWFCKCRKALTGSENDQGLTEVLPRKNKGLLSFLTSGSIFALVIFLGANLVIFSTYLPIARSILAHVTVFLALIVFSLTFFDIKASLGIAAVVYIAWVIVSLTWYNWIVNVVIIWFLIFPLSTIQFKNFIHAQFIIWLLILSTVFPIENYMSRSYGISFRSQTVSSTNVKNFTTPLQPTAKNDVSSFDTYALGSFAFKFGEPEDYICLNILVLCVGTLLVNFAKYSVLSARSHYGVLACFTISVTMTRVIFRLENDLTDSFVAASACSLATIIFASMEGKLSKMFSLQERNRNTGNFEQTDAGSHDGLLYV